MLSRSLCHHRCCFLSLPYWCFCHRWLIVATFCSFVAAGYFLRPVDSCFIVLYYAVAILLCHGCCCSVTASCCRQLIVASVVTADCLLPHFLQPVAFAACIILFGCCHRLIVSFKWFWWCCSSRCAMIVVAIFVVITWLFTPFCHFLLLLLSPSINCCI